MVIFLEIGIGIFLGICIFLLVKNIKKLNELKSEFSRMEAQHMLILERKNELLEVEKKIKKSLENIEKANKKIPTLTKSEKCGIIDL